MKVVFLYFDPHPVHEAWAKSQHAQFVSFAPRWAKNTGILMHAYVFIRGLFLPKADVYLIESPMMVSGLLLKRLFGKFKVVAINSDPFFIERTQWNFVVRGLFDMAGKLVTNIISTSGFMDDHVAWKASRSIVPPYVDTTPDAKIKPAKNKNLCFIGPHLNMKKGVDRLAALATALQSKHDLDLYLVGTLSRELSWISQEAGIIVTGKVPRPEKILEKCGVYANLARLEPAGINIIEAMAAGFTPIVTEQCGYKEAVRELSPRLVVNTVADTVVAYEFVLLNQTKLSRKARKIASRFTKAKTLPLFKKSFSLVS